MTELFSRADEIYAGMTVAALPQSKDAMVGVVEILHYLTKPAFELTEAQIDTIGRNAGLRDSFDRLAQDLSVLTIPVLAAAADNTEAEPRSQSVRRRFDGGMMTLFPSSHQGVFYLRLIWDEGQPPTASLVLHLTLDGVPTGRLALPPPDLDGTINELLNIRTPAQQALIRAIAEPKSKGHILPQKVEEQDNDDGTA